MFLPEPCGWWHTRLCPHYPVPPRAWRDALSAFPGQRFPVSPQNMSRSDWRWTNVAHVAWLHLVPAFPFHLKILERKWAYCTHFLDLPGCLLSQATRELPQWCQRLRGDVCRWHEAAVASYIRAVSTVGLVPWGLLEPAPSPGHRVTAFHSVWFSQAHSDSDAAVREEIDPGTFNFLDDPLG